MSDEFKRQVAELYHQIAKSDTETARALRRLIKGVNTFSIPAPKALTRPALLAYLAARSGYSFGKRVFVVQPLFSAYTTRCGKNLRTGDQLHWVQGQGDIIVGDDVWIDGKCTFTFASSYAERPTLEIGDGTGIGNDTEFSIGKRITIGKHCIISGYTRFFDSNGHPSDPVERRALKPLPPDQVRPITLGDDVWIGKGCIIFPGVRIGEGAIVSGGSVVRRHVPPYAVVAGNPAQLVFRLPRPGAAAPAPAVNLGESDA
jgi:acetyltransferase-like isoleucine patch superfamily enzyme